MADVKITALTAISANPVNPATFPMPMVDLLDTSMAASGTTKKVTVNQILGAGGTATLASATITGALTVDTTTLVVDPANNRVGIGTATPIAPWDVRSNGNAAALFLRTTDPAAAVSSAYIQAPVSTGFSSTVPVYGFWYQNSGMGNPAADTLNWIIASGEAMRLNSTGLGVGGSTLGTAAGRGNITINGSTDAILAFGNASVLTGYIAQSTSGMDLVGVGSTFVRIQTNGSARVLVDSSGNFIPTLQGTPPSLGLNSQMVFNLTSNTNLRISVRGTDGTTRTADITLA